MKIILTGKNGYISNNVCNYFLNCGLEAQCISIRNGVDSIDFKGVDAVLHCAAIVHKKEEEYKDKYDKVNFELTKKLADRAKKMGVKHFIFISTMAVYGKEEGEINKNTSLEPKTLYGKSKLKAEKYLESIEDDSFKTAIVRPPMVYGKNCLGNYRKLSKIARITPVIPDTENKKSLIYIENLAYLLRDIVENNRSGLFMPMDSEYISTAYLMGLISKKPKSKALGSILKRVRLGLVKKAFGSLYYGEDIACKVDFVPIEKAVRLSEK